MLCRVLIVPGTDPTQEKRPSSYRLHSSHPGNTSQIIQIRTPSALKDLDHITVGIDDLENDLCHG